MSQLLKSSGAMGAATLASRVLGLVREMVYAHFMGDTPVASAFKLAFQIPNLFRRLLGEGALSAAFIPIFKDREKNASEAEMWEAANAVLTALAVAAGAIILLVVAGVSLALWMVPARGFEPAMETAGDGGAFWAWIPGWAGVDANTILMLRLLRWMFPYMLLVCVAAVFMGMLNARGFFFLPAMSATMLNVAMIGSVLWLAPHFGSTLETQIFALAVGVLVAGLAQAGFQYPALHRQGFRLKWIPPWSHPVVRQVARKMVPGMLGVAAFQVNVLLINIVGYWVDKTIVASFDYAVRLMELPQGVFGISMATFLLSTLSGFAAEKKYAEFRSHLIQGLSLLIFVNLIASVLLTVLSEPILRLLFERGAFDAGSTGRASMALSFLAPGLVLFSVVNVLARAFYALGDTRTPMLISVVCLGLNLVFSCWLVNPMRQGGLGLANTLSAVFNVWLLVHALKRALPRLDLTPVLELLKGVVPAAGVAAAIAWLTQAAWGRYLGHDRLWNRLGEVFVPAVLAGLAYGIVCLWRRVRPAREILDHLWGQSAHQTDSHPQ
ncbi:MAG TPA: murein biosynthesis integral membrane protein MurJ [Candidatus Paceibacterota bacterium]|nr:murein biosynthesis integral membrane protein MurJ [Verrucomicrobiota bacterium]HRY51085.1 murein biosynthesis integral membrane protein MurJ [Candidatus Paceibacterota bacterium]HSA02886.1 murein biosynthesis integral membrane protein MurJ [Candidatus Paceibacterota bacterium]